MRTTGIQALALTSALVATACGMRNPATGPAYAASKPKEPRADAALVYVLRVKAEPVFVRATIVADGKEVVDLPNGGFTWFYLPPGHHQLEARWPQAQKQTGAELALDVAAGQPYHVELKGVHRTTGFGQITGSSFELLTPFAATPRLEACGYQKPAPGWAGP